MKWVTSSWYTHRLHYCHLVCFVCRFPDPEVAESRSSPARLRLRPLLTRWLHRRSVPAFMSGQRDTCTLWRHFLLLLFCQTDGGKGAKYETPLFHCFCVQPREGNTGRFVLVSSGCQSKSIWQKRWPSIDLRLSLLLPSFSLLLLFPMFWPSTTNFLRIDLVLRRLLHALIDSSGNLESVSHCLPPCCQI